jgi:hypothetical protein
MAGDYSSRKVALCVYHSSGRLDPCILWLHRPDKDVLMDENFLDRLCYVGNTRTFLAVGKHVAVLATFG